MTSRDTRFLVATAAILMIGVSHQCASAQTAEPAKTKVGTATPKRDPQVQRASAPAQAQAAPPRQAPSAASTKPPAPVVDPVAARKMEELLKLWEAKSKKIQSLDVQYVRYDNDPVFNVNKKFEGRAVLRRPDDVYLDFYEIAEGKPKVFEERIVCDGENVYQFRGPTKQVFIYPLPKDQQDKALNQGALPFLFDMTVKKAKDRYHMIFVREDETSYFIQIIPLLAIDREEYSAAAVQLSKDKLLPLAIKLWSPNGKETKRFSFSPATMVADGKIADTWFDGAGLASQLAKSKWKIVRNPQEGTPPPSTQPAIGARPAPQPAGAASRTATKGQGAMRPR